MVEVGQGAPRDVARAAALYRRACRDGDRVACANVAIVLGDVVPGAHGDARAHRERACTLGHAEACLALGADHVRAGDWRLASTAYGRACDAGSEEGCYGLARLYAAGEDGVGDPSRARGLYRRACESGHGASCLALGSMMAEGRGGAAEPAEAVSVLRRACEGDAPAACYLLGRFHATGRLVEPDPREARRYYRRACRAGFQAGCAPPTPSSEAASEASASVR